MIFLVPSGGFVDHRFGILTAPNHKGIVSGIVAGMVWAADLGCVDGPAYVKRIDVPKTAQWLERMLPYRDKCLFIAGGDVVGNAAATMVEYPAFERQFYGWPVAYVAQNGAETLPIPATCAAVFIGGDTQWKMSAAATSVIKRAQVMGKHVHIGRVNYKSRYQHFRVIEGSERFTCDGTRIRFERDKAIVDWYGYQLQNPLFGF